MILWLNTGLLPDGTGKVDFAPETVLVAKLVHDIFFFLTVFVGIAHVYLGAGIFQPYRGTIRLMFGDGKVPSPMRLTIGVIGPMKNWRSVRTSPKNLTKKAASKRKTIVFAA